MFWTILKAVFIGMLGGLAFYLYIYQNYRRWIVYFATSGIGCLAVLYFVGWLELDPTIQYILLWLAFLGAAWAARESFDQKNIANKTIHEYRRQLRIEQQPIVVIDDEIRIDEGMGSPEFLNLSVKNIGRGPAIDIQISTDKHNRDLPLFRSDYPARGYLASGGSKKWKIDEGNFERYFPGLIDHYLIKGSPKKDDISLYIYFSDQLGNNYLTEVVLGYSGEDTPIATYKVLKHLPTQLV